MYTIFNWKRASVYIVKEFEIVVRGCCMLLSTGTVVLMLCILCKCINIIFFNKNLTCTGNILSVWVTLGDKMHLIKWILSDSIKNVKVKASAQWYKWYMNMHMLYNNNFFLYYIVSDLWNNTQKWISPSVTSTESWTLLISSCHFSIKMEIFLLWIQSTDCETVTLVINNIHRTTLKSNTVLYYKQFLFWV